MSNVDSYFRTIYWITHSRTPLQLEPAPAEAQNNYFQHELDFYRFNWINIPDESQKSSIQRQFYHLIEIAIVNATKPANAQRAKAHQAFHCLRIETILQQTLVTLSFALSL